MLRLDIVEVLKAGQGAMGGRARWDRKGLIVAQVAVSVALFGMAALFVQSLRNAAAVRPGLDPAKNLLVLRVGPGQRGRVAEWCERACERLAGLPGVRGASYARRLPLSGSGGGAVCVSRRPDARRRRFPITMSGETISPGWARAWWPGAASGRKTARARRP